MKVLLRTVFGLAACACMLIGVGTASAHGMATTSHSDKATCKSGDVAPGTYKSLTIKGVCSISAGKVTVRGKLEIEKNAAFFVFSDAATLVVKGNVSVEDGGLFVLGCLESGCSTTHDRINGNIRADEPLALIFHHNTINGNISLRGGGGGLNCNPSPLLQGSPVFSDFEDNDLDGNVSVSGLRSCWFGFIRNRVAGNVSLHNNSFADPDANEVVTNFVHGNLACFDNNPHAQIGDSAGAPNVVRGHASGECKAISVRP